MSETKYVDKDENIQNLSKQNQLKIFLDFLRKTCWLWGIVAVPWSVVAFGFDVYMTNSTKCHNLKHFECGVTILAILSNFPMAFMSIYLIQTLKQNENSQHDDDWIREATCAKVGRYWGIVAVIYMFIQAGSIGLCKLKYPWEYLYVFLWILPSTLGCLYPFYLQRLVRSYSQNPEFRMN